MRIKWRGLELPSRIVRDDAVSTESYGRFVIEPFEHGFGTTIGNSLRRVLLSSLEGAAVTSIKIAGVAHEFMSIDGVVEDVTDILLNIKGIVLSLDGEGTRTLTVQRNTAGEVKAGDVVTDPSVSIVNPQHRLATLTSNVSFRAEMNVRNGRGYATAADNRTPDLELGVIPVDSIYSPVLRVRYRTEDMRVGQRTNYDRLILELWTNSVVLPEDALVEAGLILRKHLNPFVLYHDLGDRTAAAPRMGHDPGLSSSDEGQAELLSRPVSVLNLSVRASNCLEAARIATIGQLVAHSEAELLRFRSFGKTSLSEVQKKLSEIGLVLGMKAGDEGSADEAPGLAGMSGSRPSGGSMSGLSPESSVRVGTGPMQAYTMDD